MSDAPMQLADCNCMLVHQKIIPALITKVSKIAFPCRQSIRAQCEAVEFDLVAVTVTHFPEARTLQADEEDEERGSEAAASLGYDPVYFLHFCVEVFSI